MLLHCLDLFEQEMQISIFATITVILTLAVIPIYVYLLIKSIINFRLFLKTPCECITEQSVDTHWVESLN